MQEKVITQGKVMDRDDTKTVSFSKAAFNAPSPTFAKNIFRIIFALTTAATAWLAATHLVDSATKYEVTLLLKLVVDPLAYVVSKGFGIVPDDK